MSNNLTIRSTEKIIMITEESVSFLQHKGKDILMFSGAVLVHKSHDILPSW